MGRAGWVAGLAVLVAGCAAPGVSERVRDYNEDGVFLYQHGSYAGARDTFRAALALQPADPNLLYNLAQCHDRLGQAAAAEPIYQDCLRRAPNHPECRHALTVLLVNSGRRADAARMVDEWLAREPKLTAPYAEDGWLRAQAGDLPGARARFLEALGRDPSNTFALNELARLYETLHRPDRAVVLYESSLEANPHQPDVFQRVSLLRSQDVGRPHPD
jgi:Tfp pilus assembly protein PilF